MELDELINQIAARVAEKIAVIEANEPLDSLKNEETNHKEQLLILSERHSEPCHELMTSRKINEKYQVVCALSNEYECNLDKVTTIVIRHLSLGALTKIAQGIADTPFVELAIKAVLLGKKVAIPIEDMELYSYRETAPKLYYAMMMRYVEQLKNAGVCFYNIEELENILCDGKSEDCKCKQEIQSRLSTETSEIAKQSIIINKRVLTERDIRSAYEEKAELIFISPRTIVTDLAREYANQRGISFSRE